MNPMRFFILLGFLILWANSFSQCVSNRYSDTIFPAVIKTSQIKFASAKNFGGTQQDLYLDFYEPALDTLTKRPVIVYAFGGGFLIGDKNQPPIPKYATYYAKSGYAVVTIDYRIGFDPLSTGSAERAVIRGVQDLRAAVRFLAQRCDTYKIDTNAIFLTGSSAGCFSGLHSTFMDESNVPASRNGILTEPAGLGCMDCSGNNDYGNRYVKPRGIINHWGAILDTVFIENLAREATPVISFHGNNDNVVPYINGHPFSYPVFPNVFGSKSVHRRLNSIGIKNKLIELTGFGHEPWLVNQNLQDTCNIYTRPFLLSILKPAPVVVLGDSVVCKNETITYFVNPNVGSKYCFSLTGGGNIIAQNQNSITVNWNTVGTFAVKVRELSINEVNGDETVLSIRVGVPPSANFSTVINQTAVSFVDSSKNATSWNYFFGDGSQNSSPNCTHHYSPGTYTATQVVSNEYCQDTFFTTLNLDTCPISNFTYSASKDTVFFHANPSNGVHFVWTFGDGTSLADSLNPTHVYAAAGNYLVGLSVTNLLGCNTKLGNIVTLSAKPTTVLDLNSTNKVIFPNPFTHQIEVNCEHCYLKMMNSLGQIIYEGSNVELFENQILAQPAGVYFLNINNVDFIKLIKQ